MGFYSRALMSSAPDEPPEYTASMSLSVLQVPQQAGGPLVSSISVFANWMNDCLNWCISAFMRCKFCCRAVSAQAILASFLPEHR
jgi:hypothetical protein